MSDSVYHMTVNNFEIACFACMGKLDFAIFRPSVHKVTKIYKPLLGSNMSERVAAYIRASTANR